MFWDSEAKSHDNRFHERGSRTGPTLTLKGLLSFKTARSSGFIPKMKWPHLMKPENHSWYMISHQSCAMLLRERKREREKLFMPLQQRMCSFLKSAVSCEAYKNSILTQSECWRETRNHERSCKWLFTFVSGWTPMGYCTAFNDVPTCPGNGWSSSSRSHALPGSDGLVLLLNDFTG